MYVKLLSSRGADIDTVSAAWFQVAAAVAAVETTLGKWLMDGHGIGLTEYRAALHLSQEADRELRIAELAHRVGLNPSSTTRLVERLEAKQLAFRDTCPDDGRGVFAVITEHGVDLVNEVRRPFEVKLRQLLENAAQEYPALDVVGLHHSFQTVGQLIS